MPVIRRGPTGATGAQGDPGADGMDGADGANGAAGPTGPAGLPIGQRLHGSWAFDTTTTASAPGNGKFRLNNATQTLATEMYIDNDDTTPTDRSAEIDAWGDSANSTKGWLWVADSFAPASNGQILITITGTPVDSGGYRTIPVTVQSLNAIALNTEPVFIIFQPAADAGPAIDAFLEGIDPPTLTSPTFRQFLRGVIDEIEVSNSAFDGANLLVLAGALLPGTDSGGALFATIVPSSMNISIAGGLGIYVTGTNPTFDLAPFWVPPESPVVITLDAADSTDDRVDLVGVTGFGGSGPIFGKVVGTPGSGTPTPPAGFRRIVDVTVVAASVNLAGATTIDGRRGAVGLLGAHQVTIQANQQLVYIDPNGVPLFYINENSGDGQVGVFGSNLVKSTRPTIPVQSVVVNVSDFNAMRAALIEFGIILGDI